MQWQVSRQDSKTCIDNESSKEHTLHERKSGRVHLILVVGSAEHLHQKAVPKASGEPVGRPFADERHQVPASKQHMVSISAGIQTELILNSWLTNSLIAHKMY